MDSSDSETEMNAVNSSMITPSKRDIFLSTYRRQNFTFPNSMMYFIAKNPKNTKFYQKMIKNCKYFFIKNPVLVIDHLYYGYYGWGTFIEYKWNSVDINKIAAKLWITDKFSVSSENISNNIIISSIIPKLYQCDFKYLILNDQVISLNEFMILCSSVKDLVLHRVTVKYNDGSAVAFEKLIQQLPELKEIYTTFANPSNNTSKTTFKELWKIPHLSNCDSFVLDNIPGNFDIDSFYSFMKKNKKTRVRLTFSNTISEEYKTRLKAIIDEINATEDHEYKVPLFRFAGDPGKKNNKLYYISR